MPKDVSATIDGTVGVEISVLVRFVCVDGSDDVSAAMDESVDVGISVPKDVSATIDGTVDVGISVLVRSVFVDRSEDVSVAMDESVDVGMVSSACMTEDISKCDVLVDVGIFVVAEDVSEDDELVAAGTLKLVTAL